MSGKQPSKRKVFQKLTKMGFSENSIRSAINACGYNIEQCSEWIINKKASAKPKLSVGMEVWIYSNEDHEWRPGNIVSITKQLVSIIFNGWDFRWLEKESDLWKIQEDTPEPPLDLSNNSSQNIEQQMLDNYAQQPQHPSEQQNIHYQQQQQRYQQPQQQSQNQQYQQRNTRIHSNTFEYHAPKADEMDYFVTFTESVLGLELFSDEDGFNCIVGRCVSTVARQKVTPSSLIVQVNDRWLANFRFEEIRDAVKQAARNPPLHVTFRIKKEDLKRENINSNIQVQSQSMPSGQNGAQLRTGALFNTPSPYSGTSPEEVVVHPQTQHYLQPQTQPTEEEKQSQPPLMNNTSNHSTKQEKKKTNLEFGGYMNFLECDKIKIGDHIDHRDDVGRFLLATIVDKQMKRVKIHYEGWNSKWDTWCNYQKEPHRFANPRSISRKPNTRFRDLKIRDYVDINPIQRHKGWRVGQIRRMDKYSGQAQIVYKEDGQEFLYWAHLNNPLEISPFMTKAAETIALTRHLQDFKDEGNRKKMEKQQRSGKRVSNKQMRHGASSTMAMNPPHKLMKTGGSTAYTDQATYSFSGYKQIPNDPMPTTSTANSIQTQKMLFGIPVEQQMSAAYAGKRGYGSKGSHRHSPSKALPPLPPKPNQKKRFSRSRTQPLPKNEIDSNGMLISGKKRNYSRGQGYIQPINEMYIYENEEQGMNSMSRKQSGSLSNKNIPKKKLPARPPPNSNGMV